MTPTTLTTAARAALSPPTRPHIFGDHRQPAHGEHTPMIGKIMHIEHISAGETVATVTVVAGDFEAAKAKALRIAQSVCPEGRKPVWCGPRCWTDGALGGWDVPSEEGDWGAAVVCIYD